MKKVLVGIAYALGIICVLTALYYVVDKFDLHFDDDEVEDYWDKYGRKYYDDDFRRWWDYD